MTAETWLDLRNVEAWQGDRRVLHELNLQLKLRQSTTVLGPNTVVDCRSFNCRLSSCSTGRSPSHASTCLLYTSPSPRDKRQSRMPSSA